MRCPGGGTASLGGGPTFRGDDGARLVVRVRRCSAVMHAELLVNGCAGGVLPSRNAPGLLLQCRKDSRGGVCGDSVLSEPTSNRGTGLRRCASGVDFQRPVFAQPAAAACCAIAKGTCPCAGAGQCGSPGDRPGLRCARLVVVRYLHPTGRLHAREQDRRLLFLSAHPAMCGACGASGCRTSEAKAHCQRVFQVKGGSTWRQ